MNVAVPVRAAPLPSVPVTVTTRSVGPQLTSFSNSAISSIGAVASAALSAALGV